MEELLLALLGDYLEAVSEIGLSYYEQRADWWLDLCGMANPDDWPSNWPENVLKYGR